MPTRTSSKRALEEVVNDEEEGDDDYEDGRARQSRSRGKSSTQRSRPVKKKRRRATNNSDDLDDDEDINSLSDSDSEPEREQEPVEVSVKGRPIRRAVKARTTTYEETDSELEEQDESPDEDPVLDEESDAGSSSKRLVVKLKADLSKATLERSSRTRHTTGNTQTRKSSSTQQESKARGVRRSSRISHDEDEPLIGLSNSGKHAQIVRAGSREPEVPIRPTRGGKGIKYPSKSTINEASQEDSGAAGGEDVLEIKASQHDMVEINPRVQPEDAEALPMVVSDLPEAAVVSEDEEHGNDDARFVPESQEAPNHERADSPDEADNDEARASRDQEEDPEEDEEDDNPISRGRANRAAKRKASHSPEAPVRSSGRLRHQNLRPERKKQISRSSQRKANEESSDFEPDADQERDDELSASEESQESPAKGQSGYDSSPSRPTRQTRRRKAPTSRQSPTSDAEDNLAEEVAELKAGSRRRKPRQHQIIYEPRKTRAPRATVDYRLLKPEINLPIEDPDEDQAPTPSRRRGGGGGGGGGGGWQRNLFSTYGPFGGAGGPAPILGGPEGVGATGGVDSDSSDDEVMQRPKPVGGTVGMTPTSAFGAGAGVLRQGQSSNIEAAQTSTSTPANFGKIKDKQALADADPLGVDQNVTFEAVGGLNEQISQLKEMVALPLLYPEIFLRFKMTPPRGVLFHGPPGTGKTLLARALASSVSSQGKKVTFYMRKGADVLSKWVGEAEKQLRALFEEARRTQPSIIFFDEIDGIAPVRSSKQDQIHATIVSTLLALMDGMDGRGQVVIIGATNRPDSVDPALRRPGRFDREFYFPLPHLEARRAILDIHTKNWDPPLESAVKDELAALTKGYGGADLRALCTEAALNAVQRRYPQIYKAQEKLLIDAKSIKVRPKDFMVSVKKVVPASERSASSGAAPLPESLKPLLGRPLKILKRLFAEVLPTRKKLSTLEEAEYEDEADTSFGREKMQQAFDDLRVFRPRLLIEGPTGMGQQYLAAGLMDHLDGIHIQSFEPSILLGDATSSAEATMIRLFAEVKARKPSVILIPNTQSWCSILGQQVVSTLCGLLRSVHPSDLIMVLGISEIDKHEQSDEVEQQFMQRVFGYAKRHQFTLAHPDQFARREYFKPLIRYVGMTPTSFPSPAKRRKRSLEPLQLAPPEPPKVAPPLTKEELKELKKQDRHTLNMLKIQLQPIMDQIRTRYRKFRTGVIEEHQIRYLYDEADPGTVSSDLHTELLARASFRPYEVSKDSHGEPGLQETGTGKFFYNLDTVTIEKRLSNGYYKRPKDFLADIRRLSKDARMVGDQERLIKANELLANVEVDIIGIEAGNPQLAAEWERVYQRELERERQAAEKARKDADEAGRMPPPPLASNVAHGGPSQSSSLQPSTGPITLGEPVNDVHTLPQSPITPLRPLPSSAANGVMRPAAAAPASGSLDPKGSSGSQQNQDGQHADAEGDSNMTNANSRPQSHEQSQRGSNETQKTQTTGSSSLGPSAQPRPPHAWTAPSQQMQKESGMSAPLSQKSAVTPMAAGSHAADYLNSASSTQTTSAKKSSGSTLEKKLSQEMGPNLYMYDYTRGQSEVPDTQVVPRDLAIAPKASGDGGGVGAAAATTTVPALGGSQHPAPSHNETHRLRTTSIHDLLNSDANTEPSQPSQSDSTSPSFLAHMKPLLTGANEENSPSLPIANGGSRNDNRNGDDGNDNVNVDVDLEEGQKSSTAKNEDGVRAVDHDFLTELHDNISSRTTGCSVEQLEQVNSVLMDTVWRLREEWNRTHVAMAVVIAFNRVLDEMEESGSDFGPSSWGRRR